ncbi:MAG: YdcF family protein [Methylococcaceae bacterium]
MDIWITYIIKGLLLPPASLLLVAVLGCVLIVQGRKSGLMLLLSVLMTWYLLSTVIVAKALIKPLEAYPALQLAQVNASNAQAIVVLGGGIRAYAPEYAQQVTVSHSTLERLHYAATLARKTHLPMLVVGGNVLGQKQPPEAEVMATTLAEDYGLNARWQETSSRNTAENARFSYALLEKQHITTVILVTHAMHMPRAAEAFSRSGFTVLPAPTGYIADDSENTIFDFIPSARAFLLSTAAIHEYVGGVWKLIGYYAKIS